MSGSSPQVEAAHYDAGYDHKDRLSSYWHQIDEILRVQPTSILEVGIGSGFTATYLSARGARVTTLDVDPRLSPDVCGSIRNLPFPDDAFDAILCCEVLEHLPFEHFREAASELARVARRHVVVSVPDASPCFRYQLGVPGLAEIRGLVPLPSRHPAHRFDGEHYWEIGKRGYPVRRIKKALSDSGLAVQHSYRVFEKPYHRFFRSTVVGPS